PDMAPIFVRAQNVVLAYIAYIGKLFRPSGLAVIYPYDRHPSLVHALLALAALVIGSAAAILIRRHKPYFFTGWLWFLITLVPVIGIVQVGGQSMPTVTLTFLSSVCLSFLHGADGTP